jgi:hypothetical protein
MTRLTQPAAVGFRDIDSPSLRIYYPALPPGGQNAPVVALGRDALPYRPVLFIPGQREVGEGGCARRTSRTTTRCGDQCSSCPAAAASF